MIERHWDGIAAYCKPENKVSLGFVEGLNNKTLHASGLWPLWEHWKRELVRINVEEGKRAGASPFPLWDFSGYTRFTTEPFPPPGDAETPPRISARR